ncbi:MAG: hypothetical protein B6D61_03600 [Bacteroidetes bacterium 4484_249]|nr:MAG: hypothetical protein B6D61_03600 [Bacteroidetes bacterium 4484_249]
MCPDSAKNIHHIHMIVQGDFTSTGYGFSVLFEVDRKGVTGYIKYINLSTALEKYPVGIPLWIRY